MAEPRSLTLGILTGISWVSGRDYYSEINTACVSASVVGKVIPPNPLIVMVSVDCDEYASLLDAQAWKEVAHYLADGVARLVAAGADLLCIASNTGHICLPEVARRFPTLGYVHIADCTARAVLHDLNADLDLGDVVVGLLGTEPTMRQNYLKDRLALHGIKTIVPEADAELAQIFDFIKTELGADIFKPSTKQYFVSSIARLVARGARGVILGCTEIELLDLEPLVPPGTKLWRSAKLHCEAVAAVLSNQLAADALLP